MTGNEIVSIELGDPEETLFRDEGSLNREQVLERFFSAPEDYRGRIITDRLFPIGGVGEMVALAPRSSFIMPQIRDSYDAEHIVRLGLSMTKETVGQLQNGGVAIFDAEHIDQYLVDINEFFNSKIKLEDLAWNDKLGGYLITIFGHNRQLGVASANKKQKGHPDAGPGTAFIAKLFRNPGFWQVLEMQAIENTGKNPPMWERARVITTYQRLRTRDGQPPSTQEMAEKFGTDRAQIWRAQRFEMLPDPIRDLVITEELVYSAAIELFPLKEFYPVDEIVNLAKQLARDNASSEQALREVQKRMLVTKLTPEILALVEKDAISLAEARELYRLREIGFGDDVINDVAAWVGLTNPSYMEVRKEVDTKIQNAIKGVGSLFSDNADVDPEKAQRLLDASRADDMRRHLANSGVKASRLLLGAHAVLESGLAGTAVEGSPLSDTITELLSPTLELFASSDGHNGNAMGVVSDTLKNAIAQGEITDPDDVRVADEILAQIDAVTGLEESTDSADQAKRRAETAKAILNRGGRAIQRGLFVQ